jgi:hypothetical protein
LICHLGKCVVPPEDGGDALVGEAGPLSDGSSGEAAKQQDASTSNDSASDATPQTDGATDAGTDGTKADGTTDATTADGGASG